MIDRDIILRDRTYLAFLFFGCVVKFQAREANSWGRRASLNPGNRVCVLFLYLPTFRIFFYFTFTFINLVSKADSATLQLFKKIHLNDWLVLAQMHTLTPTINQTKVRRDVERPKGDRSRAVRPFT